MIRNLVFAAACLLATPSSSGELESPTGEVILTVSGNIATANSVKAANFDLEMLQALPQHRIETTTPWHEGLMRFEGPRLSSLMLSVGASGEFATVTALDDYQIDIALSEIDALGPILALKRNGEAMPPDDQGPLFIVYDYDADPSRNTEAVHSHSVWSVRYIEVR